MNWLFPPETSKYVTILRNPVDTFESVFSYGRLGKWFAFTEDSLEKFLNKPWQNHFICTTIQVIPISIWKEIP